jgi:signal transduction histidine kinase
VVQALDPPPSAPANSHPSGRTRLAVPLIARDEALGVALILDEHARSFTRAEMDRALAVAGQLALALLSARLYDALRTSYAELARTQKELIDRERLAALGELSASIAHEVRNPLGVIFNSVGSLRRILKPEGDAALLLDIVGEEADRLNRMVGDLLDYSRPIQPALQPVPLRPLFEEAIEAARQQAGPGAAAIAASVRVAEDAATVRADARLLRQALVNLFLNACQAMPRAGRLDVRALRGVIDGRPCAEIVVQDTGPGVPADIVDKIFQPFFTTKATGTGLGLAVVRRIVEGHGGTIDLRRVSSGAEFRLKLPLESQSG